MTRKQDPGSPAQRMLDAIDKYLRSKFPTDVKSRSALRKEMCEYFVVGEIKEFYTRTPKNTKKILTSLRELYFGFNVPLDLLNEMGVYHEVLTEGHMLTPHSPDVNSIEVLEKLKSSGTPSEFATSYANTLDKYISGANRVIVYDYLGRGKTSLLDAFTLQYYELAKEAVFAKFKTRLDTDRSFEYSRYLALPVSLLGKRIGDDRDTASAEALRYCSPATFKHVYWCRKTHGLRAKIYAVDVPSRFHTYAIFYFPNDIKYILFEEYRLNLKKVLVPDLRFIVRVPADGTLKTKALYEAYSGELESIHENGALELIELDQIKSITTRIFNDIFRAYLPIAKGNLDSPEILAKLKKITNRFLPIIEKYRFIFGNQAIKAWLEEHQESIHYELRREIQNRLKV